jgi:hypothetical protein
MVSEIGILGRNLKNTNCPGTELLLSNINLRLYQTVESQLGMI